jgi:hypothetical protein
MEGKSMHSLLRKQMTKCGQLHDLAHLSDDFRDNSRIQQYNLFSSKQID